MISLNAWLWRKGRQDYLIRFDSLFISHDEEMGKSASFLIRIISQDMLAWKKSPYFFVVLGRPHNGLAVIRNFEKRCGITFSLLSIFFEKPEFLNFRADQGGTKGSAGICPLSSTVDVTSDFRRNMYLCPDLCCVILSQLPPDLGRGWMVQNSEFDTAHIFLISSQNCSAQTLRKKSWKFCVLNFAYGHDEKYPNVHSLDDLSGKKLLPVSEKSLKMEQHGKQAREILTPTVFSLLD